MGEIWSKMYIGLHVKYCLFLADFNDSWIFFTGFPKSTQIYNFMEIRSVWAELFHAGGQTDKHEEWNSRFSQFCERAQKLTGYLKSVCKDKRVSDNGHAQTNVTYTAMVIVHWNVPNQNNLQTINLKMSLSFTSIMSPTHMKAQWYSSTHSEPG